MTDDQRHAAALYGTPAPAPARAPAPHQPMTDVEHQDALYTGPEQQYDATTGEPLPPPETPLTRDIVTAGVERFGLEPTEAQESAQHWQRTFDAFDVRGAEAEHLVALGVAAMAGVEADELAWRNDARTALQVEYGVNADQVLDDARRLVRQDPQLHDLLDRTQLGSNPKVVLAIARRARALRQKGKL